MAETANTLLPKLNEWLKNEGVSARVVVRGKDILEVRLEAQDLFTEQFAAPRFSVVRTHATIREDRPKQPKPKPKAEAPKRGFNLHLVAHKDSMSDADLSRLREL